jgi:hypothetical protein
MSARAIGVAVLTLLTFVNPVQAADAEPVISVPLVAFQQPIAPASFVESLGPFFPAPGPVREATRPQPLPALYAGFVGLQILDARTTSGALSRGASEQNPALSRGGQARIWAVKAASTFSTIYFVERIWKKNRVAAVLVMAGINGSYAALAAHNLKQAR